MELLGRLHPIILHLPIGFLILAWLMECLSQRAKYATLRPAVGFALQVGMWAAIGTAISGYILSWEGGYEENLLLWHQYLGMGTAIGSVVLYILNRKKEGRPNLEKGYFPLFTALMILLLATGHYGGSLTHGSDFLTAPFAPEERVIPITNLDSAIIYEDFIVPIFKKKCNSCHNESKQKGELVLSSIAGIQKSGETGQLFDTKQVAKSLILKRIRLPSTEKKHMPPKGKPQLTKDEIALLTWWIKEGASFQKQVKEYPISDTIQTILNKYIQPKDKGVLDVSVQPATEKHLQALRAAGASVQPIAQDMPFLSVSFSNKKDLDKTTLNLLKKVANQVIDLDLSESNVSDDLLVILADLPHLRKLFLQNTEINGKGLVHLKEAKYLEYLNLYDTQIDDEDLEQIASLPRLQKLFIWQTKVSTSAIERVKEAHPLLILDAGIADSLFGTPQLKAPLIVADKDIFKDSLQVELTFNFKGVQLFYTTDGSTPDSSSMLYDAPIRLAETTDLKAIAWKAGWQTSEVSQGFFAKAKHKIKHIKLQKAPNEKYAANGATSLIDYKKGTLVFSEGDWLGYEGTHLVATLDLGEVAEVSRVTLSALEDTGSYIFFPRGLIISVSDNRQDFKTIKTVKYPTTAAPKPVELASFSETFEPLRTRYVKVKVESNLKNPAWHPAPGAPCWLFVDEILVE